MTDSRPILVTGATGFVGRHLAARLAVAGRPMVLAVRDAASCPPAWRDDPRIRIVETGPLEAASNLEALLSGVGAVVHLAGLAHVGRATGTEETFMAANAKATQALAEAAARAGVGAFIHLGSLAAITGNASPSLIGDDTKDEPQTPYGRSKRAAETHVAALARHGVFAVSLRPPLIVGWDARGNWRALQRLAATGLPLPFASVRNARSMVGIGTLTQAIAHLCARDWPGEASGDYCIADREALSLPEIVTALRRGMGLPPRLFPLPPALLSGTARLLGRERQAAGLLGTLRVDASRFRRTFGFTEPQGLTEAIEESGRASREARR
jgi:UDP-glucose 4-epimerase